MQPDSVLYFTLVALAAFWAWETFLTVIPWDLPAWLLPVLVLVPTGLIVTYASDTVLLVLAGAGAVGVLHTWVRDSSGANPIALRPGRGSQEPTVLPRGAGSRLPDLP